MWGVLKKIKIMIRDWRQINENNVNEHYEGLRIGRIWIAKFCSDEDEEGMCHVMSLNPLLGDAPIRLYYNLKCLKIYIEYGGDFRKLVRDYAWYEEISLTEATRFLFEQNITPRNFDITQFPLYQREVYQEVQRKKNNCRAAYAALHLLRLSPWGRPQRDILGMVLHQIWDTRINNEWEL